MNIFSLSSLRSDNTSGIISPVIEAINRANEGIASSYSKDRHSESLDEQFEAIFEKSVRTLTVATGTAANAVALASMTSSFGSVMCSANAHIAVDECFAPEFFIGGGRVIGMETRDGLLSASDIAGSLDAYDDDVHRGKICCISLTQLAESGRCYQLCDIGDIGRSARRHGIKLHMDGARFANAVAALDCTPADMTWKSGVDVLSFGATKNGCLAAEVIVFFDLDLYERATFLRKQSGHLLSKSRFLAVQFEPYFADGLWLQVASRSNRIAREISAALDADARCSLRYPTEGNQVFVRVPTTVRRAFEREQIGFIPWQREGVDVIRFVTSHATPENAADIIRRVLSNC